MLLAACQQFLGKSEREVEEIAMETLEGHQRAIMGQMTVEVSVEIPVVELKLHSATDHQHSIFKSCHSTSC